MKARLKPDLLVGNGRAFGAHSKNVTIIDQEDHRIFGRRYKVSEYDDWFEASCFEYIDCVTFEEFIEYGKNNGANIVNGMPWSFNYKGHSVTHENDECYFIYTTEGEGKFTPQYLLITRENNEVYIINKNI